MIAFIQIWYGNITASVLESERSIRAVMIPGDTYCRIEAPAVPNPRLVSDINRVALAAAIPYMMYIDCDYLLLKRPQLLDVGPPQFGVHRDTGTPCMSMFIVNHNTQFFVNMMSERGCTNSLGMYCKLLRSRQCGKIPAECYTHIK